MITGLQTGIEEQKYENQNDQNLQKPSFETLMREYCLLDKQLNDVMEKQKKAFHKIREQQHYISDLTTSPFKLFEVNTDSKQHKSHSAIVATQKKTLLAHKNALIKAMGDRDVALMAVIENRVKAFDLTQKIDVLTKFVEKREAIEAAIQAEEEKKR